MKTFINGEVIEIKGSFFALKSIKRDYTKIRDELPFASNFRRANIFQRVVDACYDIGEYYFED